MFGWNLYNLKNCLVVTSEMLSCLTSLSPSTRHPCTLITRPLSVIVTSQYTPLASWFFFLLLLVILLFLNIGPWFFVYLLHFTLLQQKLMGHTHKHKNSPSHHGANKTLKSQEPHNYFHCFQSISGIGFQGGVYLLVYQVSGSMQQTFMMCCIYIHTKRLN